MTVITEAELREMWQSGRGKIAPLPPDVRFAPATKDFLKEWDITPDFATDDVPAVAFGTGGILCDTVGESRKKIRGNRPALPC